MPSQLSPLPIGKRFWTFCGRQKRICPATGGLQGSENRQPLSLREQRNSELLMCLNETKQVFFTSKGGRADVHREQKRHQARRHENDQLQFEWEYPIVPVSSRSGSQAESI